MSHFRLKCVATCADACGMTAPTVTAATVKAAASRLRGVVVLDVADLSILPAVYDPRAGLFTDLDGEVLGEDDGTLIVLLTRDELDELLERNGLPGEAAKVATRTIRQHIKEGHL